MTTKYTHVYLKLMIGIVLFVNNIIRLVMYHIQPNMSEIPTKKGYEPI